MTQPSQPHTPHDRAVMEVLGAVRAFSDALDRMHGGMKGDMGMNATDLAALRMLIMREARGEAVSPHQVADHLRISTASTTKLLDRLAASGHIERRPHPGDRRARVVALTDESRSAFFRHFGEHLRRMRDVAAGYTDRELDVVARFLVGMSDTLDPPQARGG
jgi:DNA-binding MarR family transcriptional regulator